ncbi:unnamed protein product [Musa acuminata subsp. malaccensis]|uniref:(wild Malaysian banana) hypothetical protein n=1 Tax=Musa acuminata subsp. malaccensis TaxID=214687 RepID=A0A804K784_MUSAM|nr:unnamed protein product [Musa acuminata subsp. malaccensis]
MRPRPKRRRNLGLSLEASDSERTSEEDELLQPAAPRRRPSSSRISAGGIRQGHVCAARVPTAGLPAAELSAARLPAAGLPAAGLPSALRPGAATAAPEAEQRPLLRRGMPGCSLLLLPSGSLLLRGASKNLGNMV